MSPTPANPAEAAIAAALHDCWFTDDGSFEGDAARILKVLLASPEALRWLGSHVKPEKLGYEQVGVQIGVNLYRRPADGTNLSDRPVYLAPRRGEEE